MEFIKADQLTFDPRPQIGKIFVEGFYQWLHYFSKDKERLAAALEHMFDLSSFFAAVEGGEIAAFVACTAGKPVPIRLDKKILRRTLGFVRGSFTYIMLTKHLVENVYPFELSAQTGSVEFVATAPAHRRKGVTYGLITHVMDATPYAEYVLKVADNNTAAIRLYEKLGFTEFKRDAGPKGSGLNHFVYMIFKKEPTN